LRLLCQSTGGEERNQQKNGWPEHEKILAEFRISIRNFDLLPGTPVSQAAPVVQETVITVRSSSSTGTGL
jgi:hypothetical protein